MGTLFCVQHVNSSNNTAQLGRFLAMRVLHELDVFKKIVDKGSVTSAELAHDTNADQVLLGEIGHCSLQAISFDTPYRTASPGNDCERICS